MSHVIEHDLGPLTWVKGEIDQALGRASEAIDKAVANEERSTQLQFAQTHVHQARGALSIIGLDGLTQFTDGVDKLLGELAREEHEFSEDMADLCRRAIAAIGNYLDELSHGAPDQALRLARLHARIALARSVEAPAESELFFPDLGTAIPRRAAPPPLDAASETRLLRWLRIQFQQGMLAWIKKPAEVTGPKQMRDAVAGIESRQTQSNARALWLAATAFFDVLAEGHVQSSPYIRRLGGRIDAQIRRLLAGSGQVSERLHRDALYIVARAPATTPLIKALHALYRLPELLPPANAAVSEQPLAPLLAELRNQLGDAKDTWDQFSEGTASALPAFEARMVELAAAARKLGRPAFVRLMSTLSAFAQWLRKDPLRLNDAISMEVASALLLAEHALNSGRVPDPAFSSQVEDAIARIEACSRGEAVSRTEVSESARRAQERSAVSQLCKEMQASLAQVEQALDGFFRAPQKRELLAGIQTPVRQVEAILTLLDETEACDTLSDCETMIAQLADPDQTPDAELFEPLADQLSALGFYIDSLRRGRRERHHLTGEPDTSEADEPAAPAQADADDALPDLPTAELTLPDLPPVAETAAEAEAPPPPEQAQAEPAIEHEEDRPEAPVPVPAPSAEATHLLAASDEEIDAELLEIFIEEAREVLGNIDTHLAESRANPADVEALTVVRRGFHTLKGSGRMVGLNALGEAAWALEQTLNRWLQLEWAPTPALHALVAEAHQVFSAWVEQLASGGSTAYDAAHMVAEADRLAALAQRDESEQPAAAPTQPTPTDDTADIAVASDADAEVEPELPLLAADDELIVNEDAPAEPALDGADAPPSLTDTDLDISDLESTDLSLPLLDAVGLDALSDDAITGNTGDEEDELADLELLEDITLDEIIVEQPDETAETADAAPEASALAEAEVEAEAKAEVDLADDSADSEAPVATHSDLDAIAPADEPAPAADDAIAPEAPHAIDSDMLTVGSISLSRPLYQLYLNEARHHLNTLHREITQLQVNPTRIPQEEALRAAHTLAGISGTAGFATTLSLGRALEHALARLIDTHSAPTAEQTAVLATATDTLDAMIAEITKAIEPLAVPVLEAQLDSLLRPQLRGDDDTPAADISVPEAPEVDHAVQETVAAPEPEPEPAPVAAPEVLDVHDEIDEQLLPIFLEESADLLAELGAALRTWRADTDDRESAAAVARLLHTLKGSARMTGAMSLGEHLHALEGRLEAADTITGELLDSLDQGADTVQQYLDRLAHGEATLETPDTAAPDSGAAPEAIAITPDEAGVTTAGTLRVRADLVDRFVNDAGEIGIARTRVEGELRTQRRALLDLTENVIRLRNQLRELEIQADTQMQTRIAQAESEHTEFDPLEMDRYTRLQELTRMMAESVNDVTTVQHTLLRNLDGADAALTSQGRLNRDLQQALMSVRMTPFDSLADRLYRVVRQSAKELGKRANLDLRGGRIELDRSVLERITGPLEHLLRNAIAHGIEAPDARKQAGKAEIGEILLTVRQEGNEVVIDMADDGAGLNFERIEARARENGLLAPDETADEGRLTNLIFVPGFSTASSLSAVSGRGVGMDVVKAETAAVGGRIEVTSTPGGGTRFRLYLPLTLAVTQALLVRAGGRTFAIPSTMVAQVMELKAEPLAALQADGGTTWQDTDYRYRYLPRLLGDRDTQPEVHRFNWVLLLRSGTQTLALHVDALRGNQEIVVKKAGPQLARLVGYTGATVLGNGEIVLIINPVALAGLHVAQDDSAMSAPIAPAVVSHEPTVMVVDDSLTVRKITGRLLEREGFRVVTAKDGVDALEQLLDTLPDVILSDIEMPRMDGFDLARNIRNDPRLKAVPIVMITSRLADKHREYARQIGVNHYLGKPYQEEELLALIREYTALEPA
ncbi:hybrid sensor histidine kinase/response regulator [Denitromonas iodatirespirans]|uniref:Chemotaxis protein CheA n=1 Tax=Denitromonas iodatirespirans TaxID=2795389 RepID=A0A944D4L2_DENI1|nr:Hpt domain-containing protein [Denitromonas iodatirespirans]MBT0959735.1 Hpt domain-containing protein [Denitromonas iodatirespirans]